MPRLAKADVARVLDQTGKKIIDAGGPDGRVSRKDIAVLRESLRGTEQRLVDVFFSFIDHRDAGKGAQVTAKDVNAAVAYAKTVMLDRFDPNNNGFSKAEIEKITSVSGHLAVALAKAHQETVDPRLAFEGTSSLYELRQRIGKAHEQKVTYTSPDKVPVELSGMILEASRQASYTGIKTLKDAFAAVDQNEIVVRFLTDKASGAKVIAVDYGAGDNTYGGLFDSAGILLAAIHDGDLMPTAR
jgi:hypothetical protein